MKIFYIMVVVILILMTICLYDLKTNQFNYKDGIMVYELCRKKTGSQTNNILKTYGETETQFKFYLLNR